MAFIKEDWWKDTKWFKVFLASCLAVILFIAGGVMLMPKPDMMSVQSNFGVEIPSAGATRLYKYNSQGWLGDGEDYTVWQYRNTDKLMEALNWKKGQAFQNECFQWLMNRNYEQPDGYFLPRELEQEVSYYYQGNDKDGHTDDRLLIIFAPEVKLGDGKYYENLLFVLEWYS